MLGAALLVVAIIVGLWPRPIPVEAAGWGRGPRVVPDVPRKTRLAGLEPLDIDDASLFVNVGERTNVTGSRKFARLVLNGDHDEAVAIARQQVESGAQMIDINMDEALLDSEAAMARFLDLIAGEPDIAKVPVVIDSSKWSVLESGLRHVQGKAVVNSVSLKEGEAEFLRQAKLAQREFELAALAIGAEEHGEVLPLAADGALAGENFLSDELCLLLIAGHCDDAPPCAALTG